MTSNDENAEKANCGKKESQSDSGSSGEDQQGSESYSQNQNQNQPPSGKPDTSHQSSQNNYQQKQQHHQASADKPETESQSGPGFEVRPGCMPVFNESRRGDPDYLSYWAQVQNYCKA